MESDRLFYQGKEYFDGARLTKADDPTIVSHLIYQRNQFDEAVNQKVVREDHFFSLLVSSHLWLGSFLRLDFAGK